MLKGGAQLGDELVDGGFRRGAGPLWNECAPGTARRLGAHPDHLVGEEEERAVVVIPCAEQPRVGQRAELS